MTEHIDDAELAYQQELLQRQHDAQVALRTWTDFIQRKYKFGEGDALKLDGTILRGEKPSVTPPEA